MSWFYLSFADEEGFLGGCYVEGSNVVEAVRRAWVVGCNPGGSVRAAGPIPDEAMDEHVEVADRERLLSYSELEAFYGVAPWPMD